MIVWIPALTFLLVSGVALLFVMTWLRRYSPQAKAKFQRMQHIQSYQTGESGRGAQEPDSGVAQLEKWLREHVPAFVWLEVLVERAHGQRTAIQVLGLGVGAGMAMGLLGLLLGFGAALAGVLALVVMGLPVAQLHRAAHKRRSQFEAKLPEALDFLARALRAGHSITVAMGMAGDELEDPIGTDFRTVYEEIGFGIPFGDAMTELARRIQSHDLDFLVIALLIQRETGGNLTELLDGLAKTVRDRIKLQGKVRTLSAEGRFSAILLGSLPFGLGGILTLLNPAYMEPLWNTPQGHNILGMGGVFLVLGFVILSRIIQIKV